MLVKNLVETLEAAHDAPIRGCSTPHCIKLPTVEELDSDCKQRRNDFMAAGATLSAAVRQPTDKLAQVLESKGRKIIQQKLLSENHKLTEYFPVRRSIRKCKKVVLEEQQRDLENKVLCGAEDGLQVRHFPGKGRGVVTTRNFVKGEYVVEYAGELIDLTTAKKREVKYAKDQNAGCYMYYFQHRNQQYCVDATAESSKFGRLVNHSRNGNLTTRIVTVKSVPHLVLIAKDDIPVGVEVTYDYGDRSRESIRNHPWLAL
ncbi:histone-lysine N-methyltransferase PR-Set7-like [Phymastichus coffea]|uniref:histone-lysine N-methyltransferase PR-Set7-like n=1 Tax=Phymastichus coffea TaxID=108790 RepID=UPI00273C740E|nr:histone-lysine N-methyltransferase PR-Set7-like [Phymastichus coffea]XP_058804930.1 histone-lysine N-methyltransferase PR-Set7-like [Phymastichus coffea]